MVLKICHKRIIVGSDIGLCHPFSDIDAQQFNLGTAIIKNYRQYNDEFLTAEIWENGHLHINEFNH